MMKIKLFSFALLALFTTTICVVAEPSKTALTPAPTPEITQPGGQEKPATPKKKKKKGLFDLSDAAGKEDDDVNISADHMQMLVEKNVIEMDGNVIVQNSTMNLVADKMRAYMDKNNELSKIDAEGNVIIRKLLTKESAVGDFGHYDAKKNRVTLTGNCTLMQNDRIMKCEKITYDTITQVISAERGTIVIKNAKKQKDDSASKSDKK